MSLTSSKKNQRNGSGVGGPIEMSRLSQQDDLNRYLRNSERKSNRSGSDQDKPMTEVRLSQHSNNQLPAKKNELIVDDFLSDKMILLKDNLTSYIEHEKFQAEEELLPIVEEFEQICSNINIPDEQLMALYLCVTRFSAKGAFQKILVRSNSFIDHSATWYTLFTDNNIFAKLQISKTSKERCDFNLFALEVAIKNEYAFMIEEILDGRAVVTNKMVELLLKENQIRRLVHLVAIPREMQDRADRPLFVQLDKKRSLERMRKAIRSINQSERPSGQEGENDQHKVRMVMQEPQIQFMDIIHVALEIHLKSDEVKQLISLIQRESSNIGKGVDELNLREVFREFTRHRRIKLLRYLFGQSMNFEFTFDEFFITLELETYDIAALLHMEFGYKVRDFSKKASHRIVAELVQSMNKAHQSGGMIEEKCYLIREFIEHFQLRHARSLLDFIENRSTAPNKQNLFVNNFNVVKTGCLLIEVLEVVSQQFDQLKIRCEMIRERIEDLVAKYMDQVEGEQEMRFLLLEKDIQDRDALDLITTHLIFRFLKYQFAENVVKEIWRSPYATSDMIFSASTNWFLLFEYYDCNMDEEMNRRFFKGKTVKAIQNHSLQFMVWRYSGKSRLIVEGVFSLVITAVLHILLREALNLDQPVSEIIGNIMKLEDQYSGETDSAKRQEIYDSLTQAYATGQPIFEEFFGKMMNICWLSFLCLLYAFQQLGEVVYVTLTSKYYNPYNFRNFLDVWIFVIFLANINITFARNLWTTIKEGPGVVTWEEKAAIYSRNYAENMFNEHNLLILGVVSLWIRVINFTKYNEYMGRFLGVVRRLIQEIALIFILYLLNLVGFSLFAESAFRELPEYNTRYEAFKTLFYSSFGTHDFDVMVDARLGERFGISYLIAFLIINVGLFMSLFVSIITVLFQEFQKNENVYQMIETLKIRSTTEADKKYSILISVPPPLNILLLITVPFLMSSPNIQRINERLLMAMYSIVLVAATITFLVGEMILWPFVFIKMTFHKLTMVWVYSKSFRVSRADKFTYFIIYVGFGFFINMGNTVIDLYFFLRHLVQFDLQKIKHKTKQSTISKENFSLIEQFFEEKQEKVLNFKKISAQIRNDMDIIPMIQGTLFPEKTGNISSQFTPLIQQKSIASEDAFQHHINKNQEDMKMAERMREQQQKMLAAIKEFQVFKQILDRNSQWLGVSHEVLRGMDLFNLLTPEVQYQLYLNKFKTIDCKVIHCLLEELRRQRAIAKIKAEEYIFVKKPTALQKLLLKERTKYSKVKERAGGIQRVDQFGGDNGSPIQVNLIHQQEDRAAMERSRNIEKRERNLFKKFYHHNISRMLKVLNYVPSQSDERKFLYSNYRTQLERELKGEDWNDNANLFLPQSGILSNNKSFRSKQLADDLISMPLAVARDADSDQGDPAGASLQRIESKGLGGLNLNATSSLSMQYFINDMSEKVFHLSQGSLPRIQNSVLLFKHELDCFIGTVERQFSGNKMTRNIVDEFQREARRHGEFQVADNHF